MIFSKQLVANAVARAQLQEVHNHRAAVEANEGMHAAAYRAAGLQVNTGIITRDVYQEFDNVTVQRFRSDDGDTFLNDLLPLSRSVNIGKLVQRFRQSSDSGNAQSSMTGQIGVIKDQVEYKYDGSIIPVHDLGFGRNWREWNAMQSEGFDALIDDQRESVATLRRHLADSFINGHKDKGGNYIVVDGLSWKGMKNDTRVAAVDLDASGLNFDFTSTSNTGEQIKAAFIQVRNVLYINNNCEKDAVYYVSREIASNFERKFSANYDAQTIRAELGQLLGVATIKVSSKLSGNEIMAFPLDQDMVRPVVGMGLNTVAMPRPVYNSNYDFVVWGAIGWQVRTDYFGKTCALFARNIA